MINNIANMKNIIGDFISDLSHNKDTSDMVAKIIDELSTKNEQVHVKLTNKITLHDNDTNQDTHADKWNIFNNLMSELSINDSNQKSDMSKNNANEKCLQCGNISIIQEDEKYICTNCGIVSGRIISFGQEWRNYMNDNKSNNPTRCGAPIHPLLPNSSMGTVILGHGNEYFRRLQRWNSITYRERSLLFVFDFIKSKCQKGDLPNIIVDRANVMYKILSEEVIMRNIPRKALIAACLYYSCKDKDILKSTKDLSDLFGIKMKKITSGCKKFNEIMYLKNNNYLSTIKPTTYNDCINDYCKKLCIDEKHKKMIINIATISDNMGIVSENTPPSIAVGSIYLYIKFCNLEITKKNIANKCSISEVTISKTYKKMYPYSKYLLKLNK